MAAKKAPAKKAVAKTSRPKAAPEALPKKTAIMERKLVSVESLNLVLSAVILAILLFYVTGAQLDSPVKSNANDCSAVCVQIGSEYSFVDKDGVCWCKQSLTVPSATENSTMEIVIASQIGIIESAQIIG